jgi:hypothetical protein
MSSKWETNSPAPIAPKAPQARGVSFERDVRLSFLNALSSLPTASSMPSSTGLRRAARVPVFLDARQFRLRRSDAGIECLRNNKIARQASRTSGEPRAVPDQQSV